MEVTPMEVEERHNGEKEKKKKTSKWVWLVGILAACAVVGLVIGLTVHFTTKSDNTPDVPIAPGLEEEQSRIDCFLEATWGVTEVTLEECESRGCTYDPSSTPGVPDCYVGPDSAMGVGYTAGESEDTDLGFTLDLHPNSEPETRSSIPEIVPVKLTVEYYGADVLRIKMKHLHDERYEVPKEIVDLDLEPGDTSLHYRVDYVAGPVFQFSVVRVETDTVLFDTSVGGLFISDQYLTVSTRLPSNNVYGFGENSHDSFRHDLNHKSWGMFARDQWVGTGVHNHYSVQPFYTCLENDGNSHGVLILNSNAMDYTFTPLPMLTFRTVGGVLDMYFFLGPSPENVVQQYTGAVGRPYMPPYWSLGFQLCRYGYNTLERLQEAVNRTRDAGIPQDVQYADIDHYDVRRVFTVDNEAFNGLPEYFDYLRSEGMRTVIILDPCLVINYTNYEPYDKSRAIDGNIKWSSRADMPDEDYNETNTTDMLGFVWPMGKVVFPDFFLERTGDMWAELIVKHFETIKFDGLWIDMNEPANFGTNEDRPWNWPEDYLPYWSLKCPASAMDDPPYRTMASFVYDEEDRLARLSEKTLCMTAKQKDGMYDHYDVHSLYGSSQEESTLRGLREATGKRGLVVSRSTFVGSGKDTGHWLGDNFSEWPHLKDSIVGMLEFNLFGFPYIGADICGFFEETNAQMCLRWQQLGAFYTYARNHNQIDNEIDQDPANFNELVTAMSREALLIRYTLLPYLYTLFYKAHTEGNTVIRPLFHEFPTDEVTPGIDEQFMWGSSLLISPILFEDQTELTYYLPAGVWYDYYTGQTEHTDSNSGAWVTIPVQLNTSIPLHMRGGYVIPTQQAANNTHFSRMNPFDILVYLDDDNEAHGSLFWDDGEGIDTIENDDYYSGTFTVEENEFEMSVSLGAVNPGVLQSVNVHGLVDEPSSVLVGGSQHTNFVYNDQILRILDLDWTMDVDLTIVWS